MVLPNENVVEDLMDKKLVEMEEGYSDKDQSVKQSGYNNVHKTTDLNINNAGREKVPSLEKRRLASLDVFRGLTVALMVLVDDVGGIVPTINHSPWDGVTLADFVMPMFLFIVGLSLALAYKRVPCRISATKMAVFRAIKLFVLGLVLQGGYFHGVNDLTFGVDIQHMRLMGTLQRIAIAYLVSALCEIWIKGKDDVVKSEFSLFKRYRVQLGIAVLLTVAHTALLYGLRVPDWEYQIQTGSTSSAVTGKTFLSVNCGVRGNTGPACNAVGMIDRMILGTQHMYARPIYSRTKQCSIKSPNYGPLPTDAPSWCQAPFEPEGLLSSIMAIVSCILGLHYGHVIVHIKDHKKRIMQWTIPALVLLVLGFIMHFSGMHFNKVLYSSSYTCLTAGTAGILFAGIYVLVDVYGYRRLTFVLEWMGKHSMMIYILAACNLLPIFLQGFYWKNPENNIFRLIGIKS
ncbi:Heparan-alpha-glucosaminide n-acetyltransferase [Thalictrum thalictroides]|uniref:Heparan-alpha-glucosaminide n-acetyltransferase n=1 Tax=Thalictrum thalictroides TaxID=46969 RepID=A0A7J6VBT0_THATH|nr:Heparan-alpha-glucosaminide n-acetyltransferase [Thalictrum thalictroides]